MTPEEQAAHRAKAEKEAGDDLAKDARWLLNDIHDELIHSDRPPLERLVHAQKRLASLSVKNAEASDRSAAEGMALQIEIRAMTKSMETQTVRMTNLTDRIVILTYVAIAIGVAQIVIGLIGLLMT